MNKNTVQIWRGPSRIDGVEIVVLLSGLSKSGNVKTGNMFQTYILRADIDPMQALKMGLDVSICGGCIHRPKKSDGKKYSGRSCYVNVGQGPLSVWRSWKAGNVASVGLAELEMLTQGRTVRLGSYGDPAAVPAEVWAAYTKNAKGWTGYTHQARSPKLRDVLEFCQVSADSCDDAKAAMSAGVGSFRVMTPDEKPLPGEMLCPASEEAGKVTTCADCRACSGFNGANVAIYAHGIGAKQYKTDTGRRALSLPVINPSRAMVAA